MKRTILILGLCLGAMILSAQEAEDADTLWKFSGITSLNLSQLSLTNWAAGGDNSVAGNALLQFSADYNDGKHTWDNDVVMGYGLIRQGSDPARKSDDQIDLTSKFGIRTAGKWSYTAMLSFRTQFSKGYDRPGEEDRLKISNFLAPGYLNIAAGMDYKPAESFSLFLSPVTGKVTIVNDGELSAMGAFGVDSTRKVRGEIGGYIKARFTKELLKNVTLDTKIDLFSNYLENTQYVDVNWDLLLSFKVNDYISATLMTQLIYDHDIQFAFDSNNDGINDASEPRVQFKELFGIGFTYKF